MPPMIGIAISVETEEPPQPSTSNNSIQIDLSTGFIQTDTVSNFIQEQL